MRELKEKKRPIVRSQRGFAGGEQESKFWGTAGEDDDEAVGFEFTSPGGEGFVMWVEEHQLNEGGADDEGAEDGDAKNGDAKNGGAEEEEGGSGGSQV